MITIIDYGAGNLTSVRLSLETVGVASRVSSAPEEILQSEKVVFPGVGAAGLAMEKLRKDGLDQAVKEVVAKGVPFLGICLGTQILLEDLEEDGGVKGLGLISGTAPKFSVDTTEFKVPHMGWNQVRIVKEHPLFSDIDDNLEFYFVHSYYPAPALEDNRFGVTEYGGAEFVSVIGRDNIIASQFHPEKSGRVGLQLLKNFSEWEV